METPSPSAIEETTTYPAKHTLDELGGTAGLLSLPCLSYKGRYDYRR